MRRRRRRYLHVLESRAEVRLRNRAGRRTRTCRRIYFEEVRGTSHVCVFVTVSLFFFAGRGSLERVSMLLWDPVLYTSRLDAVLYHTSVCAHRTAPVFLASARSIPCLPASTAFSLLSAYGVASLCFHVWLEFPYASNSTSLPLDLFESPLMCCSVSGAHSVTFSSLPCQNACVLSQRLRCPIHSSSYPSARRGDIHMCFCCLKLLAWGDHEMRTVGKFCARTEPCCFPRGTFLFYARALSSLPCAFS
ncbi:hypothetical protein C8R47DRAFT_747813 [Mycena vitilis]|nr:hypothetical protein C8R47DRAFT_747813 [Mycena vitilis]